LGARVSVMPFSLYKRLDLKKIGINWYIFANGW
jgi:hypothetical protein